MKDLNVRLLLTNAAKNCPWVSYTFLQKPRSFKRLSILEENCVADIINVTFKSKTFVTNVPKPLLGWVMLSCKSLVLLSVSAFGKKIVLPTSIMEELIVRLLLTNAAKNGPWVSYTFLQKPRSFKRLSILEENGVADINNRRFKCRTFVDKCCKKLSLSKLYFPTKASFF